LLSETQRRYRHDKKFLFYKDFSLLLKELKPFEEFSWIKEMDSASAQQTARDLDLALRQGIDKSNIKAFPKHKVSYKIKKLHDDSFRIVNQSKANNLRIENGCVLVPKIGPVPIKLHRPLAGRITTATLFYRHGHWNISFVQEIKVRDSKETLNSITGYDINSQNTVVDSCGWAAPNPKALKKSEKKLKQIQIQLSRRKKGSNRWHKSKSRLQKIHGQISNQRLAFAHELSNTIAKATDIVVFEDLNVKGMQQWNGRMGGDNVMGLLPNLVRYKVKREGGIFHQIGRFEKSTGICSECGHHHKLTLKDRRFACTACKTNQNRDQSSAIAIERLGEKELRAPLLTQIIPHE
jgi:putative transposase